MTASGFTDQGSYTPDNLIAGEYPRVDGKVTIPSGQGACVRGQALQADGTKATTAGNTASILAMDADATSADAEATIYKTGMFNAAAIVGYTIDAAAITALEAKSIFLKTNVGY